MTSFTPSFVEIFPVILNLCNQSCIIACHDPQEAFRKKVPEITTINNITEAWFGFCFFLFLISVKMIILCLRLIVVLGVFFKSYVEQIFTETFSPKSVQGWLKKAPFQIID